jgi:4'-phosphopantetheinyl transferase
LTVRWVGDGSFPGRAGPCGLAIIGVRGQSDRETARLRIRAALVAALAAQCDIDASQIELVSPQGAAPSAVVALDSGHRRIALSISHDGDISVAAYSFNGAVGIDVTSIVPVPDWQPVARDYLGLAAAEALAARPHGERDTAFAHAWSEHEARLKCLGLQLDEWRDELAPALRSCRCFPLALPEGYVGYLALTAASCDR